MNKEQKPTKNPITLKQSKSEDAIKITVTAILILGGAWVLLKITKEMLKELEGIGLQANKFFLALNGFIHHFGTRRQIMNTTPTDPWPALNWDKKKYKAQIMFTRYKVG